MSARRVGRRLGLVALAVAAAALLGEAGLRVAGVAAPEPGGYPRGLYVPDPDAGFALARGFEGAMELGDGSIPLRTNAHGFRDDPFEATSRSAFRVLALGDSFGFGHAVAEDEAYPEVLERLLGSSGDAVEVLNLGVPGYDPLRELALLERLGKELEPDLVLVGCYVGNDPADVLRHRDGRTTARFGYTMHVPHDTPGWLVTARAALETHSRVWRLVRERKRGRKRDELERTPVELRRAACEHVLWSPGIALELLRTPPTERAAEALARTADALAAIASHSEDVLGVPCVVVLLPAPHQYHQLTWRSLVAGCELDEDDWDRDAPNRALAEALAADDVPVLDLTPAFRAASAADPALRLFLDVHFDPRGHALAAERIAAFLEERGLAP